MNSILAVIFLAQVGQAGVPGAPAAPAPTPAATAPAPAAAIQVAPAGAAAAAPSAAQPGPAQVIVTQSPEGPPQAPWWQMPAFFGVMILVFWLLIIRPQQKQRKKQEEFLTSLNSGDKVITAAGFIGRIVSIAGDVVTIELAKDVRVKVVKAQISSKYTDEMETAKPSA